MKITICVILANGFPVPAPFIISYSLLQQWLLTGVGNKKHPRGQIDAAGVLWVQDFPIDFARNRGCRLFLDKADSDYLLFLDADMTHPPDLPNILVSHGVDVVTGRYTVKKPPFFSVAMRKVGDGPTDYQAIEKLVPLSAIGGLMPIDAGGAGALLVSRRALEAIRAVRGADDWFRYQDGPDGLRSRSEDMWFYEGCREAGFQPYLDADARCQHIAQLAVDDRFHVPYQEAFLRQQARQQEVA